jgi:hypothetical protein
MRHHELTLTYVERRTTEGLTRHDIIRCLKSYIARKSRPSPTGQLHAEERGNLLSKFAVELVHEKFTMQGLSVDTVERCSSEAVG